MNKLLLSSRPLVLLITLCLNFHSGASPYKAPSFNQPTYSNLQISRFVSCSSGPVNLIPIAQSYQQFVIISKQLDEECFGQATGNLSSHLFNTDKSRQKNQSLAPLANDFNLKFAQKSSALQNLTYEISKTLSPFQVNCFEECHYVSDELVKIASDYYFLFSDSDYGVKAKVINNDLILFTIEMATREDNVMLNRTLAQLTVFPSGYISEFDSDSVIVRKKKSYFETGGAFWYDIRVDYTGELIQFIDVENGTCLEIKDLPMPLRSKLTNNERKKLCVQR